MSEHLTPPIGRLSTQLDHLIATLQFATDAQQKESALKVLAKVIFENSDLLSDQPQLKEVERKLATLIEKEGIAEEKTAELLASIATLSSKAFPANGERVQREASSVQLIEQVNRARVQEVDFSEECSVTDSELQKLHGEVVSISLAGCRRVSDEGIKALPHSVKVLHLDGCAITDAALEALPEHLEELSVCGCHEISDQGLQKLPKNLTKLTIDPFLFLHREVTKEGLLELTKDRAALRVVIRNVGL